MLKITKIPTFNSIVIRQDGEKYFISAPNSIVISKDSLLLILEGLLKFEFLDRADLTYIINKVVEEKEYADKENNDSISVR